MIDKGHCKLLHEGDSIAEFAEFYDYTPSYPEEGKNEEVTDGEEEVD